MSEITDELKAEAVRPHRGFLVVAAVFAVAAIAAYLYEEDVVNNSGPMAYALMLITLVIFALFMVQCYRVPQLGNRMLGYDIVLVNPSKKLKADVQYTAGFNQASGADLKRMNSRRKQARSSRKRLAQVTRDMHKEQAESAKGSDAS